MNEDRLEEIKSYGKSTVYGKALVTDDDIKWLISELEKSRAEVLKLEDQVKWLANEDLLEDVNKSDEKGE